MKDMKRLQVGAVMGNTQSGVLVANLVEFDGGDYNLTPKVADGVLVLVDPNRPAAYGLQIQGEPEHLRQLGNALLAVARQSSSADDTDAE